jgi:uncharacterized protein YndB with AHSA1/START domain
MDRGTYIDYDGRPAELSHWFPSSVAMKHEVGATIEFTADPNVGPTTGVVLEFDPPHRLAYTWGNDELHFHLAATGTDECTLTLIDVLEADNAAARNAAGWTVCLAELDKHVAGHHTDGPHGAESWQPLYESYIAAGLPSGAWLPGD